MTISINGTASGSPDHTLVITSPGAVSQVIQCPGSFSDAVWKGKPLLLTEAGDPTEWMVVPKGEIAVALKVDVAGSFTRSQLEVAFTALEIDRQNGRCLSHEKADALTPLERGRLSAETLMRYLNQV